jgi:DNA-binding CsgD family transcriptional regulator
LEALALLGRAEQLADRDPIAAAALLGADTPLTSSDNRYIQCWVDLVRGRIARDTGDLATCLLIGRRLTSARSSHMVFNGMILLTQAGLLAAERESLAEVTAAASTPIATARMIAEAGVARIHLGYLDGVESSRVDPEFGVEPMTPGSLWLCGSEAIDAGDPRLAVHAVAAGAPDGPLLHAVTAAVEAAAGSPHRWYDALSLASRLELKLIVVDALEGIAALHASTGRSVDCLRMIGAAARLRDEIGYRWRFPGRQAEYAKAESQCASEMSAAEVRAARDAGAALPWEEAAAYALRRRGRRQRPRHGWDSLTPTELRVVELVAEGLTNPQIGTSMMTTQATAKSHLDHVFVKLGVHSRAEVAAAHARWSATT